MVGRLQILVEIWFSEHIFNLWNARFPRVKKSAAKAVYSLVKIILRLNYIVLRHRKKKWGISVINQSSAVVRILVKIGRAYIIAGLIIVRFPAFSHAGNGFSVVYKRIDKTLGKKDCGRKDKRNKKSRQKIMDNLDFSFYNFSRMKSFKFHLAPKNKKTEKTISRVLSCLPQKGKFLKETDA